MKILVVNCGSSSLKYQLIDMDNDSVLASGKCDRIGGMGINMPFIEYKKGNGQKVKAELELPDHTKAFETVIEYLTDPEIGAIKDLSEINGIGHRIVNGGPKFTKATLVTDEVMEEYKKAICVSNLMEKRIRKNMVIYKLTVRDETGLCQITWFNQRYLKNKFKLRRNI